MAEATPALVPLLAAEPWVGTLAGIVLPVRLWIRDSRPGGRRVTEGPMLFTHSGISGPATLDISGDVAVALQNGDVTLCAQVAPGLDAGAWSARLEETAQKDGGRRTLRATLAMWMPARLADTLLDRERMNGNMRLAGLSHANRDCLAALLGALPLKIRGTGAGPGNGHSAAACDSGSAAGNAGKPACPRIVPCREILTWTGPAAV